MKSFECIFTGAPKDFPPCIARDYRRNSEVGGGGWDRLCQSHWHGFRGDKGGLLTFDTFRFEFARYRSEPKV